jgi:hypothetical protein
MVLVEPHPEVEADLVWNPIFSHKGPSNPRLMKRGFGQGPPSSFTGQDTCEWVRRLPRVEGSRHVMWWDRGNKMDALSRWLLSGLPLDNVLLSGKLR